MGALQFDKDLRRLVSYFTSVAHNAAKLTGTTVRGEFARLSQISSLLNLEKARLIHGNFVTRRLPHRCEILPQVSEVAEYWDGASRLQLRLTPSDVRLFPLLSSTCSLVIPGFRGPHR